MWRVAGEQVGLAGAGSLHIAWLPGLGSRCVMAAAELKRIHKIIHLDPAITFSA